MLGLLQPVSRQLVQLELQIGSLCRNPCELELDLPLLRCAKVTCNGRTALVVQLRPAAGVPADAAQHSAAAATALCSCIPDAERYNRVRLSNRVSAGR